MIAAPSPAAARARVMKWARAHAQRARSAQLHTLQSLQHLDAAVARNMAHGAMAGFDPLTESLFDQLEAPAEEGAHPAIDYAAVTDASREFGWLPWAMVLAAVGGAALTALYPLGFAQ